MLAQARQRLAQGRLRDVQHFGGAREAVFAQQRVEHLQVIELQFRYITVGNSSYTHRCIV